MNVLLSIAMFTPVPPKNNAAGPAALPPFVNPPSLTGASLAGQGGGLMGAADPLRTLVKPSEAMKIPHHDGNCCAYRPRSTDALCPFLELIETHIVEMAGVKFDREADPGKHHVLVTGYQN